MEQQACKNDNYVALEKIKYKETPKGIKTIQLVYSNGFESPVYENNDKSVVGSVIPVPIPAEGDNPSTTEEFRELVYDKKETQYLAIQYYLDKDVFKF